MLRYFLMPFIEGLIYFLTFVIALLLTTGGASYSSPTLKIEFSEIDAFAWALFALAALHRAKTRNWFPAGFTIATKRILNLFSKRPVESLAVAVGAYVALQTWNSVWRFDSFHANAFDLSYVDQALWSTTRFGFLHSSLSKGETYLGEHFSPILGLVALIYRVSDSINALFFFQSLVLASGAALVYALALAKKIPKHFGVLLAVCYLLYQPLRGANGFDFREDNLFIPIFLGLLLAVEKRRRIWFWLLCFLSWYVKENAPIFTALIGLWIALESGMKKERLWRLRGIGLAMISVAAFLYVNTKITPHFAGGGGQTMAAKRLRNFGATNGEILAFMFSHPFSFAREFARPILQFKALKYFATVTLPFLPFAATAPLVALIALAGILMNLIVNLPTIGFHYECILIPFLFYVLVTGVSKCKKMDPETPITLILSFLLFFGRSPIESIRHHHPSPHARMVSRELRKIPAGVSVATQSALHPHLTHRRDAFLFSGQPNADYVIADLSPEIDRYATPNLEADVARIDPQKYKKIFDEDRLLIWQREAKK